MKHHSIRSFILTIALLGIVSCKTTTNPVTPASGSGTQLFFSVEAAPDSTAIGLYSMGLDGSAMTLLYPRAIITSSPRAGKIAFIRYSDQSNQNLGGAVMLGTTSGDPATQVFTINGKIDYANLSPDGTKIVYDAEGSLHIYDITSATDRKAPVSLGALLSAAPAFSGDGSRCYAVFENAGLVELNASAGLVRRLAVGDATGFLASEAHQIFDLSPASDKFTTFTQYETDSIFVGGSGPDTVTTSIGYALSVEDLSSGVVSTDTTNAESEIGDDVTWSPFGDKIAYISQPHEAQQGTMRVAVYDIASRTKKLFRVPAAETTYGWIRSLEWSKDGTSLYLSMWVWEGQSVIQKLDIQTGAITTLLTRDPGQSLDILEAFRSRDVGEH